MPPARLICCGKLCTGELATYFLRCIACSAPVLGRGGGFDTEDRSEHVLIGLVVSRANQELCVCVLIGETLDNFPLVRMRRPDLEVLLADNDIDRQLLYHGIEQGLAFFGWEGALSV